MYITTDKFIRDLLEFKFTAIVNLKGESYLVDCCDTLDAGIELMVFKFNEPTKEKISKNYTERKCIFEMPEFEEVDWEDLYVKRFKSIDSAEKHFDYVVTNLEKVLKE